MEAAAALPALEQSDLHALDEALERAIATGDAGGLDVLGHGEFSLVVAWPHGRPAFAVKRLPVFADAAQLERYERTLGEYVTALTERGVPVVPTELRRAAGLRAYIVQPLVPDERLLNLVLRDAPPERARALLAKLAEHTANAVDVRLGLDAQAANWAVEGDEIATFDVTTPLMRDAQGRDVLDLDLFGSIYPWALRGALRRIGHSVAALYHEPRTVLLDAASNLVKEELDHALPALLDAANEHVRPAITEREVRRYFARDRKFWLALQRLRRADRAWQRRVRRRTYPFLLPPPYAYGPPERSKPR